MIFVLVILVIAAGTPWSAPASALVFGLKMMKVN
jgi:hypothetical protein